MARIVIKEVILPDVLLRAQALAKNPAPILRAIGAYMKAKAADAFRGQGRPPGSWQARAVPNIAGIIRDFHDGRSEPKEDRFTRRPALHDSGDLRGSIDYTIVGNGVEVGSNLHYGATHQFGEEGVETEEITEEFQEWLSRFMTRQVGRIRRSYGDDAAEGARGSLRKSLGFLLNPKLAGDRLEVDVPARPFIDVLPEDERNIETMALDMLSGKVPA